MKRLTILLIVAFLQNVICIAETKPEQPSERSLKASTLADSYSSTMYPNSLKMLNPVYEAYFKMKYSIYLPENDKASLQARLRVRPYFTGSDEDMAFWQENMAPGRYTLSYRGDPISAGEQLLYSLSLLLLQVGGYQLEQKFNDR